jgi:predicted nucleotide-binding protein
MGEIELVEANKTLIEEGGVDNEVYFILAGKMNVFVKGNFVAERVSGDHVGEMVALNPDSRRTATIRAIEDSIVLKISEADFTNLLDQHPIMYKSIAKALAKRLDDRKCLLKPARNKVKVFIISSAERLDIVREIENAFDYDKFHVKSWTHNIFCASNYPLDDLISELNDCDFAIAIAHDDDQIITRRKKHPFPRDNVIFELGMAMGILGRNRAFLMKPRDSNVHLPSDITGLTPITYKYEENSDLANLLSPACNQIRSQIKKLGVRLIY